MAAAFCGKKHVEDFLARRLDLPTAKQRSPWPDLKRFQGVSWDTDEPIGARRRKELWLEEGLTRDEVVRLMKANMSAGLEISQIVLHGDRVVEVVVGDANFAGSASVPDTPQEARTLEEYKRWRDKGRSPREPKL